MEGIACQRWRENEESTGCRPSFWTCERQSKLLLGKVCVPGWRVTGLHEEREEGRSEDVGLPWVKGGQYFLFHFFGRRWETGKIDDPSLFPLQMGLRRLEKSSVQCPLGPLTGKHLFVFTVMFYDSKSKLNIEGPHPL